MCCILVGSYLCNSTTLPHSLFRSPITASRSLDRGENPRTCREATQTGNDVFRILTDHRSCAFAHVRPRRASLTLMEVTLVAMERSKNLSPICTVNPPTSAGLTSMVKITLLPSPTYERNAQRPGKSTFVCVAVHLKARDEQTYSDYGRYLRVASTRARTSVRAATLCLSWRRGYTLWPDFKGNNANRTTRIEQREWNNANRTTQRFEATEIQKAIRKHHQAK